MTDPSYILQAVHERRMAALMAGESDPVVPGEPQEPTGADLGAAQALERQVKTLAGSPGSPASQASPGSPARLVVPCPLVAIVNRSEDATDAQVAAMVPALQKQVERDYLPHWGSSARLIFCGMGTPAPSGSWQVVVCDDSDQGGAWGYLDTTAEGLPLGKAYWRDGSLGVSRELLAMLADPLIQTVAFLQDAQGAILYAREICDPCSEPHCGYLIDGVAMSDFVLPAWFNPFLDDKAQTSFCNQCAGPFRLAPGGYISTWTTTAGWGQYSAERLRYDQRAAKGSRRERRALARNQWQRSVRL